MKMVKMEDSVHAELKGIANGRTLSDVVKDLLSGSSRTDLDIVLGQLEMLFKAVDNLNIASDVVLDGMGSSGNIFEKSGQIQGIEESYIEKEARLKREEIARLKAQKHAIEHPEDCDQTGGWS